MSLRIAVDFDGTITRGETGQIRPEAAATLALLKKAGHHLVLHSARCSPSDPAPPLEDEASRFYTTGEVASRILDQWNRFEEMRRALKIARLWDLFDEIWQAPGKPNVDIFIDDLAETPDWVTIAREFGGTI